MKIKPGTGEDFNIKLNGWTGSGGDILTSTTTGYQWIDNTSNISTWTIYNETDVVIKKLEAKIADLLEEEGFSEEVKNLLNARKYVKKL